MCRAFNIAIVIVSVILYVEPARILGVYPIPSISHQVVFRALTLELIKKGHELVVITPDPAFKDKKPVSNLTEIDISASYQILLREFSVEEFINGKQRGSIIDFSRMTEVFAKTFTTTTQEVFKYQEVNALIENKDIKFDLVLVEALCQSSLIFGKIFDAPVIMFSSFYGWPTNFETMGAVSRHPMLHPHIFRSKFRNLTLMDKIKQFYYEYKLWKYDIDLERLENNFLKYRFGSDAPTVAELKKNIVLLFTNTHAIFDGNRPTPPAVVNLGGLHLQPLKALPQDLKSYLDSSSRGVVYVSLGTNVRTTDMEKDFLDSFIDAFEALPYDVLWKFDGDHLERMPKNVKVQKWFPQRDLLNHTNIKAFIMQGGLQSTDEAIETEVPLIGIPMLADQWFNANKFVELGIGISLDSLSMTADDLTQAVHTLIEDKSYKERIKEVRSIIYDQPSAALERAVWWTEYALRHRGSRHLLGSAAQFTWTEYLMLDVVAFLAAISTIVISINAAIIYYLTKLILHKKCLAKVKQN